MSREESTKKEGKKENSYLVVDDYTGKVVDLYIPDDFSSVMLEKILKKRPKYIAYSRGELVKTLRSYQQKIKDFERKQEVKVVGVIPLSAVEEVKKRRKDYRT